MLYISLSQILVDGVPLVELDIKWLRERIGFVGQVPTFSVLESIYNVFLSKENLKF